ncbi:MAG TPA: class I SAM-dependent methyltransferase [Terriglobales bacterium]|nr:class I SAM-dependent methyltransferase [Terriglobales bacterium]
MSVGDAGQIDVIRRKWDEHARDYDAYYQRFAGAVEHYVDWELLKRHLPANREARILDAGGGTGRITLPLLRLGYRVTLCDLSPGMLEVARRKVSREGLLDRVELSPCDVHELRRDDDSFDLVLCWIGAFEAIGELARVTKPNGTLSLYLVNRCRAALNRFSTDPGLARALLESRVDHVTDGGEQYRVVAPEEVKVALVARGIEVVGMYALCGWLELLGLSKELRQSRKWDEGFFRQTAEAVLRLSQDPSVAGMAWHVVAYGRKG